MKQQGKNWFAVLLHYADNQKTKFYLSVVFSIFSVISGLIPYYCFYRLLAQYMENTLSCGAIIQWSCTALLFYFVKVLLFSLSTGLSHQVAFHVLTGIRKNITANFLHAPLGIVQKFSIGEIKNILVDKAENIEPPLAHVVPEGAGHLVLPIISILALTAIDWRLGLSSLVTVPGTLICTMLTFKISGDSFQKYNGSNAYMNSTIVEYVEGIEVIKAFGKSGVSYEKYAGAIENFRKFVLEWMASTWITMKLAFALFPSTLLGTLPVGLLLASRGQITAADTCLAVMLSMSMVTSLARLEVYSESIRQMKTTVEDLQAFMTLERLPEPESPAPITGTDITLSGVHFSYSAEGPEVLHNLDLHLPEGSFTALVGPSGSGKSTIAKLIARFWDVTGGSITIGNTDIRKIPLDELSSYVSFVAQDNFLFRCSILENIRIGNPNASDEEVKKAARLAQCEEFIHKLPKGYDTSAGEAGKRLSGGEKQRVAIARMILKNAPIVILDEATAFTDPENEDKLQTSISALTKGKTLLVIAHRLSTIRNADNIIVLEKGRVISQGTQEKLLKDCPLYRDMWQAHIGAKQWAPGQEVQ